MLGDADDQPQIVLDHLLPRLEIAIACGACIFELGGRREQRILADLVQVDLGDVVEKVGADPHRRDVERKFSGQRIGLAGDVTVVVVVEAPRVGRHAGGRYFDGSMGLPSRRISK